MKYYLTENWTISNQKKEFTLCKQMPKTVLHSCLEENIIKDPFYRDNEYDVLDFLSQVFIYEHHFQVEEAALNMPFQFIVFEGIDTLATIELNGQVIANTNNMHRTYRLDIKAYLKKSNYIKITFFNPIDLMDQKQQEDFLWGTPDAYSGIGHIRKAHYMFGWDWGPKLPDVGIFRPVYLDMYDVNRINDVMIEQIHGDEHVNLNVEIQFEHEHKALEHTQLEVSLILQGRVIAQEAIVYGQDEHHCLLTVNEPELWWPVGMGKQPLYELRVAFSQENQLIDEWQKQIGLRTATVKQEKDQWGESFEFCINGQSVFAKGGNYIPEDNIITRQTYEKTQRIIEDCVNANMNTIRVWGGGYYPNDYFFQLCDQYGLMVWEDLMFACSIYRVDEQFEASIVAEVEDNLKRIRHHASIVLICGNNEMEEAYLSWGGVKDCLPELKTEYVKQFEIILPKLCKKVAPHVFYWKSSPSSGGHFDQPNNENYGDVHDWNVWHGLKPFVYFQDHYYRFLSEFGLQSFPTMETVRSFTIEEDLNLFSPVMELHQKNKGGNNKILHYIAENYLYPNDFEGMVRMSQLVQAEGMRYAVEHLRRHLGRCMGTVYWQLNDCWPAPSWSSLDSLGHWKMLHYMAKRFFNPVLISAKEKKRHVNTHLTKTSEKAYAISEYSGAEIAVTNESDKNIIGSVKWFIKDHSNQLIVENEVSINIPKGSVQWVCDLDFSDYLTNRITSKTRYLGFQVIVDESILSQGSMLFVEPKTFQYLVPEFTFEVKEDENQFYIGVQSTQYVQRTFLELNNCNVPFSDNCFEMMDAELKWITLSKKNLSCSISKEYILNHLKIIQLHL